MIKHKRVTIIHYQQRCILTETLYLGSECDLANYRMVASGVRRLAVLLERIIRVQA